MTIIIETVKAIYIGAIVHDLRKDDSYGKP